MILSLPMDHSLVTTSTTELAHRETDPRDLLAVFLGSLDSENTRAAYRRDLEDYFDYLASIGQDVLTAPRPAVDAYARTLEARGLAPSTRARKLSAVSAYYGYAVIEGFTEANPVKHVKRPPVSDHSSTLGLTLDEFARLLDAAEDSSLRERVLVGLLGEVGLRVSAVCEARIEDLTTEQGYRVIRTTGKGGKVTTRTLPPDLERAIDDLIGERVEGPILLRPRSGKAYDRFEAARLIHRLAARAGIEKRITPHSLRHTHATLSLLAGAKLEDVSHALGHSDPRTTMRYLRALEDLENDPAHALARSLEKARSQVRENPVAL